MTQSTWFTSVIDVPNFVLIAYLARELGLFEIGGAYYKLVEQFA